MAATQVPVRGADDSFEKLVEQGSRLLKLGDGADAIEVRVFPVGLVHIKRFTKTLSGCIQSALQLVPPGAFSIDVGQGRPGITVDKSKLGGVVPRLVEIVATDMLDLVADCCKPRIDDLPHWHLAEVVTAFVEVNFSGEQKLRPWVTTLERILTMALGERVELWDDLSSALSQAATAPGRFSPKSSQGSPTRDGASPSTAGGPS